MDTLTKYRGIISCVLKEYQTWYAQGEDESVDTTIIQDDANGEYLLMRVGWRGEKGYVNRFSTCG